MCYIILELLSISLEDNFLLNHFIVFHCELTSRFVQFFLKTFNFFLESVNIRAGNKQLSGFFSQFFVNRHQFSFDECPQLLGDLSDSYLSSLFGQVGGEKGFDDLKYKPFHLVSFINIFDVIKLRDTDFGRKQYLS